MKVQLVSARSLSPYAKGLCAQGEKTGTDLMQIKLLNFDL